MSKKVELEILDISDTQAQAGAYVILLGEKNGSRKLPLIVGSSEAQATAIYIKGVKTQRPLTHDLFHASLSAFGALLLRILIYKVNEGVFYSYLFFKQDEKIIRIDARTSDAIALAIRSEAPILIYDAILEAEKVNIDDSKESKITVQKSSFKKEQRSEDLEKSLKQAIEDENYELAALLRDELSKNK